MNVSTRPVSYQLRPRLSEVLLNRLAGLTGSTAASADIPSHRLLDPWLALACPPTASPRLARNLETPTLVSHLGNPSLIPFFLNLAGGSLSSTD